MITIKLVKSARDVKEFVDFPFKLYKKNPYWVPPLKNEAAKHLKEETNPALAFCDAQFWTAWKDGECVGRIGAIINHNYNKKVGKKMGRFTRLEFIDDAEVSSKLLQTAENWLLHSKMEAVHGPLGFSNFDNQGLLIEGFEYLPSIASVMHFPYYQKHLENLGYEKEIDWIEFRVPIESVPEKAQRLAEIIKERNNLEVIHLENKSEIKKYMMDVFDLVNITFHDLPFVALFPEHLVSQFAEKYVRVLRPEYIVILKKNGKLVAFIIGLPSLSKAMQKAGGKLFPFGFYHIKKALKHTQEMDLLLIGVDPHLQRLGLPAILISQLQKTMIENGIQYVETTGMFESNQKVLSIWKNFNYIQHRRRRCFIKKL